MFTSFIISTQKYAVEIIFNHVDVAMITIMEIKHWRFKKFLKIKIFVKCYLKVNCRNDFNLAERLVLEVLEYTVEKGAALKNYNICCDRVSDVIKTKNTNYFPMRLIIVSNFER